MSGYEILDIDSLGQSDVFGVQEDGSDVETYLSTIFANNLPMHRFELPNDPIISEPATIKRRWQKPTSETTISLSKMIFNSCVYYAESARQIDAVRVADEDNKVLDAVIPRKFLSYFGQDRITDYCDGLGVLRLTRTLIPMSPRRVQRLQTLCQETGLSAGQAIEIGYDFRTNLLKHGPDVKCTAKYLDGTEVRVIFL